MSSRHKNTLKVMKKQNNTKHECELYIFKEKKPSEIRGFSSLFYKLFQKLACTLSI